MASGELANESDENQVGTSCQICIYIIIIYTTTTFSWSNGAEL